MKSGCIRRGVGGVEKGVDWRGRGRGFERGRIFPLGGSLLGRGEVEWGRGDMDVSGGVGCVLDPLVSVSGEVEKRPS